MSRREQILKRWRIIISLLVSLIVVILLVVSIKEIYTINQSVEFFENELFSSELENIKSNVNNRLDLIEYVKEKKEESFRDIIRDKTVTVGDMAIEAVKVISVSSSLEEKRDVFLQAIVGYDEIDDEFMFFASDLEGNYVLTGLEKNLQGQNFYDVQDVVTGEYMVREAIEVVETYGEGFVQYYYMKVIGGEPILKTSYLKYYDEVELYIGTGLYDDDYVQMAQEEVFTSVIDYYKGSRSYIFINSFEGVMLAHRNEELVGTTIEDVVNSDGESFNEDILTQLEQSGEAYVEYFYSSDGYPTDDVVKKYAYFKEIDGWDAYIGMAISLDDIEIAKDDYVKDLTMSFIYYLVCIVTILGIFYQVTIKLIFKNFNASKEEFEAKRIEIEYISYHDHLTGLYNRRFFDESLNEIMGGEYPKMIVMGDVNGLKLINDAFGHASGDTLLTEAARVMKSVIKDGYIFRWGGDEFLLTLNNVKMSEIDKVVNEIVSECKKISIHNVELSISLGYAPVENSFYNVLNAINEAEEMMYTRKLLESRSAKATVIENILNSLYDSFNFEQEHAENVKKYSVMLAEQLHMTEEGINKLTVASLLHDIGKIGMSDSIVTKTTELTDDEWIEMKKHPEKGYRILSAYSELSEFASLVLQHHERYDGTGYPHGIKGEKIPLFSRIIGIADAYDAMTSDRVYRDKLSKEEAIKELVTNRGTQFDPFLVDMFLEALKQDE